MDVSVGAARGAAIPPTVVRALLHARRIGPLGKPIRNVVVRLLRFVAIAGLPLHVREPDERGQVDRIDSQRAVVIGRRTGEIMREP